MRTDHGSGFRNDLIQQFCSSRGIRHIFSPVGDHRGTGLVEPSIQTIKRKLGTAKLDPNFGNFKETIQQIIEIIARAIILYLKNCLSSYILGVSQILNGLKLSMILFILILQLKDLNKTFLRRTRLQARTKAGIALRWCPEEVPALRLLHNSNRCFPWRVMRLRVSLTRH